MHRYLREGTSGKDVRAIQQALVLWLATGPRPLGLNRGQRFDDGIFGPRTKSAVQEFQRSQGLVADGIVGPLTLAALYPLATYYSSAHMVLTGPAPGGSDSVVNPVEAPHCHFGYKMLPGLTLPIPVPLGPSQPPALPATTNATSGRVADPSTAQKTWGTAVQAGAQVSIPVQPNPPSHSNPNPGKAVTALTFNTSGFWLLDGQALKLSAGEGFTVPISDGAKYSAFGFAAIAWAPGFLKVGDTFALNAIVKAAIGLGGTNGQPGPPLVFGSGSITGNAALKLGKLEVSLGGGYSSTYDDKHQLFSLKSGSGALTLNLTGKF